MKTDVVIENLEYGEKESDGNVPVETCDLWSPNYLIDYVGNGK